MRRIALFAAALAVAVSWSTAGASTSARQPSESEPATAPAVASVSTVKPPRKRTFRHRFRPWAQPTPRQMRQMIRIEARRWRIDPSRLARRVGCESGFRWSARGGPYVGLLQFHSSTFHRGLSSIRTRRVRMVRKRTRMARTTRVVRYTDGTVRRKRGRRVRQRIVHVYEGRLPRRPELTHGWTQVRIGAQAIRGVSAVSSGEWGCPA